jgi:putative FmdB family regulatory protein
MLFPKLERPMPIYEYRCAKCGFQKEFLQRVSDKPLTKCPECGKSALAKMVTAAGFQLKGTGWYATDFKGGGAKPAAKTDKSETKPDSKPAAADKPADSAGKDASKPAPSTPTASTN